MAACPSTRYERAPLLTLKAYLAHTWVQTPTMERGSSPWQPVLVVLLVLLVLLSLYSALTVSGFQSQLSSLQNQNIAQQQDIIGLQNQVWSLESKIALLSREVAGLLPPVTDFYIQSACVSATEDCGGSAYSIILANNGTTSVPNGYSVYLGFNDTSRKTFIGFNTTLPSAVAPGQTVQIISSVWPPNVDAADKLSPGDAVDAGVLVGSFQALLGVRVITCYSYTTTETQTNYTVSTYTQTQTITSCY